MTSLTSHVSISTALPGGYGSLRLLWGRRDSSIIGRTAHSGIFRTRHMYRVVGSVCINPEKGAHHISLPSYFVTIHASHAVAARSIASLVPWSKKNREIGCLCNTSPPELPHQTRGIRQTICPGIASRRNSVSTDRRGGAAICRWSCPVGCRSTTYVQDVVGGNVQTKCSYVE